MCAQHAECDVLLHGLRKQLKFNGKIEHRLKKGGGNRPLAEKIYFVTHSLGGILVRQFLQNNGMDNIGHTVMLGPPYQGSEVVDRLGRFPSFKCCNCRRWYYFEQKKGR